MPVTTVLQKRALSAGCFGWQLGLIVLLIQARYRSSGVDHCLRSKGDAKHFSYPHFFTCKEG